MKNQKLYQKAIEYAVDAEVKFHKARIQNARFEDRSLKDKHQSMELIPAANAACAQQELIAYLFDVSDEKVNEDVNKIVLAEHEEVCVGL